MIKYNNNNILILYFILLSNLFIIYSYSQQQCPKCTLPNNLCTSKERDGILCKECNYRGYIKDTGISFICVCATRDMDPSSFCLTRIEKPEFGGGLIKSTTIIKNGPIYYGKCVCHNDYNFGFYSLSKRILYDPYKYKSETKDHLNAIEKLRRSYYFFDTSQKELEKTNFNGEFKYGEPFPPTCDRCYIYDDLIYETSPYGPDPTQLTSDKTSYNEKFCNRVGGPDPDLIKKLFELEEENKISKFKESSKFSQVSIIDDNVKNNREDIYENSEENNKINNEDGKSLFNIAIDFFDKANSLGYSIIDKSTSELKMKILNIEKYNNNNKFKESEYEKVNLWKMCSGHGIWNFTTNSCQCNKGWSLNELGILGYNGEILYSCITCIGGYGPPVPTKNSEFEIAFVSTDGNWMAYPSHCSVIWTPDPLDGIMKECSGHGKMNSRGECECYSDDINGYWEIDIYKTIDTEKKIFWYDPISFEKIYKSYESEFILETCIKCQSGKHEDFSCRT